MTARVSRAGTHRAAHNISGIARKWRRVDPGQLLLSICKAGTMSILQRRHTNILPRFHRSLVIRVARKALRRRKECQWRDKEVATLARELEERLLHRAPVAPCQFARARNRIFCTAERTRDLPVSAPDSF